MSAEDHPADDTKDAAILRAAFVAFARYGLRRTSMADIAQGAGMSRPALYLHYSGKEDIFNALVRHHFRRSETAVAAALRREGSAADTLLAVLHAIDGEAVEAMLTSPHADEILSSNTPFTQAEVLEANARIAGQIAEWIAQGQAAGRFDLSGLTATPAEVAELLLAAKHGLKTQTRDFAAYRAAQSRLAAIFARALTG